MPAMSMSLNGCDIQFKGDCRRCRHTTLGISLQFNCNSTEYCCGDSCCSFFDTGSNSVTFWMIALWILILCVVIGLVCWYRRCTWSKDRPTGPRIRSKARTGIRGTGSNARAAPTLVIPDSVITAPPSYMDETSDCPKGGPPPYRRGSGTSNDSMPRFPPPYEHVDKGPPPSYTCVDETQRDTQSVTAIADNINGSGKKDLQQYEDDVAQYQPDQDCLLTSQ